MSGIRKRRFAAGIAAVGTLALAATACSSSKSSSKTGAAPVTKSTTGLNTINSGTPKKGGSVTFGIEKAITDWNSLDANGNTEDFIYAENGIYAAYGEPFIPQPDGSVALNTDLLTSATITSSSPQTITYQINPKAVWSDGTPVTAADFIYNWIAQTGVDANIGTASGGVGYQDIASVVGSGANDQTVTVTWTQGKVDPDWKGLFDLLPEHLAAQHGYNPSLTLAQLKAETKGDKGLEQSWNWFNTTVPTWSIGPYLIQSAASDGTKVVEVPNPKWWGKGPYFDKMTFVSISDSSQEAPALQNGEVDILDPQPSQDIVTSVKNIGKKVKYQLDAGLQFEHFDFNLQNTFLGGKTQADQEDPVKLALRQAMFTATNRQAIIARTQGLVDPSSKPLNSRMFVPSQSQYQDNVSSYDLGNGDVNKAKQILEQAGYKNVGPGQHLTTPSGQQVPAFLMRYTQTNSERATECQIFATEMAQLGITIKVEGTDDLGKTLNQSDPNHTFDIIVFAWVDTPFWDTGNAPLYESNPGTTVLGGNYGYYTNSQVDNLLHEATQTLDLTKAASLENQADKILSQDAVTLPLFQKDSMIAFDSDLVNVRDNITSQGASYNVADWGFAQ